MLSLSEWTLICYECNCYEFVSKSQSMFLFIKAGNSMWTCRIISSVKRVISVRCSNQWDDNQVRVSTPFPIKQTQTLTVAIWEYAPDYMFTKSVMPWLNETSRKRFVDINKTRVTYETILKNKDFDLHKLTVIQIAFKWGNKTALFLFLLVFS